MKRLFDVILAHPKLVLAAAIAVAAVGWRVGKSLPVDVFPEIREARVVVQVEAGTPLTASSGMSQLAFFSNS